LVDLVALVLFTCPSVCTSACLTSINIAIHFSVLVFPENYGKCQLNLILKCPFQILISTCNARLCFTSVFLLSLFAVSTAFHLWQSSRIFIKFSSFTVITIFRPNLYIHVSFSVEFLNFFSTLSFTGNPLTARSHSF
jgi:hypothetical protein